MRASLGILVAGALLSPLASKAGTPRVPTAPEPAWVDHEVASPPANIPTDKVEGGAYPVLIDFEENCVLKVHEFFCHEAYYVVNEQGVPAVSEIDIDFDPSYQQPVLNFVRIRRGNKTIDALMGTPIRVIQREKNLEQQVYDGSLTALLLLPDVRVGDLVEYGYTLRGENPALSGHYYSRFPVNTGHPVGQYHRRLLWPKGKPLAILNEGGAPPPKVADLPGEVEYRWVVQHRDASEIEDGLPSWYDPFPVAQMSSCGSWSEVARWAVGLYQPSIRPGPLVAAKVEEIRRRCRDDESRAIAAIRFVQDEVRYLGIEFGNGSLRPTGPGVVIRRRFGDCKDKTFLLVTMLRQLGISSDPALVNTIYRGRITGWLPACGAFDHAIVRIIHGRDTCWVDPTVQSQRGRSLKRWRLASFGCALVVAPGTSGLSPIPAWETGPPLTTIHKTLETNDYRDSTRLTVVTEYRGVDADDTRYHFHDAGRDGLSKGYLDFYAKVYPGIKERAPLQIDDDDEANVIKTVESYSIPGFWKTLKGQSRWEAEIATIEFSNLLAKPRKLARRMPLAVDFPRHLLCTTIVRSPEKWNIRPGFDSRHNEAILFSRARYARHDTLYFVDEIQTLKDFVPASNSNRYVSDLAAIDHAAAFSVISGVDDALVKSSSGLNWPALAAMLFTLALSGFAAARILGSSPARQQTMIALPAGALAERNSGESNPQPTEEEREAIFSEEGASPPASWTIGGWLYLLGAGVLCSPISVLLSSASLLKFLRKSYWTAVMSSQVQGHNPSTGPLIIGELSVDAVLFVGYTLVAILFLQRRALFPRAWIAVTILSLLVRIADSIATGMITGASDPSMNARGIGRIIGGTIALVLWAFYLQKSERARRTFVV